MSVEDLSVVPGSIPVGTVPDSASPPVARQMDGHVAVLTMQAAPHNFVGPELFYALIDALAWAAERNARAVLLRSSLRNFCAGADLDFLDSGDSEAPEMDFLALLRALDRLPMPIVAAVNGVCVGGGLELALGCDLIVAAESAKIGSVEASIGLNPLMGGIQRVTERAGAARAKEMALLARRYDAATMERWNIINRVVPDERLAAVTESLAHELANGPTIAHASTKALVSHAVSHGVESTDEAMAELQAPFWRSKDLAVGMASLRESGPGAARFEGR